MPISRRRKQTQRGKVCLREGPFSIGSADSGARGPSTPRDALSLGCGVRGVRAECLGVLRPLCPESGPGREWRGAGRFRLGAARLQERGPLLLPPPLSTLRGCPAPGLSTAFPTPGSWLPAHPPLQATLRRQLKQHPLSHRSRSPPPNSPALAGSTLWHSLQFLAICASFLAASLDTNS